MKKQVVVIGLGRFGESLAKSLFDMGNEVLAIDMDAKKVENVAAYITHAVQADATSEAVLKELGISSFDMAVVAVGTSIQNSVLCTILLKKLGVPSVIARAANDLHGSILEKIGADKVVRVEHEMGVSVAHGLAVKGVQDYITVTPTHGVARITVPPSFVGRSLLDIGFGRGGKLKVTVLLIQRENEIIVTPDKSELIKPNDSIIVTGSDDKIEQMIPNTKEEKQDR